MSTERPIPIMLCRCHAAWMDPYQPPIVPGPPQPPTQYNAQPAPPDPNAGIRKAGTVAIWVWVVLTLIPVAVVVLCVGLCMFGAVFGDHSGYGRPVQ